VVAVWLDADRAGGEPAGRAGAALGLAPGEAHPTPGSAACLGVRPVLQCACQGVQAGVVGLLGVLTPPGGHLVLGAVPLPPQRRQRPGHLHVKAGGTLVEALLDQVQAPVEGTPGRAAVRPQRPLLPGWGRGRTCTPESRASRCQSTRTRVRIGGAHGRQGWRNSTTLGLLRHDRRVRLDAGRCRQAAARPARRAGGRASPAWFLALEVEPVGAAGAELFGGEREDRVAVEQQQDERQQGPDPGPHHGVPSCSGSHGGRPDQASSQARWASAARRAAAVAAWTLPRSRCTAA